MSMRRFPSLTSHRAARQRGLSLIELVVFIVVVAIGLTGILSVLTLTAEKSSDPMVRKQGIAVAEAMLEEVLLKSFADACPPLPLACTPNEPADRPNYTAVTHYNGWNQNGVASLVAPLTTIIGLENYNVTVAVVPAALGDITLVSGDAVSITVIVTVIGTVEAITLVGFRTSYF
jgi:MSHA pilin protein MshD